MRRAIVVFKLIKCCIHKHTHTHTLTDTVLSYRRTVTSHLVFLAHTRWYWIEMRANNFLLAEVNYAISFAFPTKSFNEELKKTPRLKFKSWRKEFGQMKKTEIFWEIHQMEHMSAGCADKARENMATMTTTTVKINKINPARFHSIKSWPWNFPFISK